MATPIVQYIVLRSDLVHALQWPTGALVAQACHACSAVLHLFHSDPNTQAYTSDLDRMHKIVLEVGIIAQGRLIYSPGGLAHLTTTGTFLRTVNVAVLLEAVKQMSQTLENATLNSLTISPIRCCPDINA